MQSRKNEFVTRLKEDADTALNGARLACTKALTNDHDKPSGEWRTNCHQQWFYASGCIVVPCSEAFHKTHRFDLSKNGHSGGSTHTCKLTVIDHLQ